MDILTPQTQHTSVRVEGDRVLLIHEGRLLLEMPYQVALELGRALVSQAKLAETHAVRDTLVEQQAVLMRLGLPFGFIPPSRPDLMRAAGNEAAWNSRLRKWIRQRPVEFAELYAPTVTQDDPSG